MTSDGDDSFGDDPPTQRGKLEIAPESAPRLAEFSDDQTLLIGRPMPALPSREPLVSGLPSLEVSVGFSRNTQTLRQPLERKEHSEPVVDLSYEAHHSEKTILAATGDHSVHSAIIVEPPPSSSESALVAPDSSTGEGVVKAHSLFREQALQSYLTSMRESEVLRVAPPWARGVMIVATLVVLGLIGGMFVVRVEQTGRGRGVLRVAGGVQGVVSQTTGVVVEVLSRSGDQVTANAMLVRIDSTPTKVALLEAERQITRADEDVTNFENRRDHEQAERIKLLKQRGGLLAMRAKNQRATVARLRQRLATYDKLVAAGLASTLDRGAVENEVATSEQQAIQLEEELSATNLQVSSIAADLAQELERLKTEVKKAKDKREALNYQLQQTEVHAPRAGRIEALVSKVGDTVSVGSTVARLIPEGAPRQVVVFLPEADRAFLQEGSTVNIELDQLPVGEFGSLHAKVVRIAVDLASAAEISEVLGDAKLDGPAYRVELAIEDGDTVQKLDKYLRPGSLVTARFVLRTRRLATLLFEPLGRFLRD